MPEECPAVAASLLVQGKIFSQTNMYGAGEPNLHPVVRDFVIARASAQGDEFSGKCAEVALISDQFWGLESTSDVQSVTSMDQAALHFDGAVIFSRKVRPPNHPEHDQPSEPCSVCKDLIDALGIRILRR
ncbi:YwqJ-related putative deaminase [Nocardia sp. NPDC052001]|uniref:YwqJ-related putative deaminase n=1 Tax=Nocardia sp. NPDC052001 TaxID=3154853 RepID=UPI003438532A